jgi:hypothetical protein
MTDKAGVQHAPGGVLPDQRRGRVVGKAQLAVSTLGVLIVLAMVACGRWLEAGTAFLLTVGLLEIMFQRALVLFHGGASPRMRREAARAATAAE